MRHRKHNHQLGVKTAHRISMLANLSCSLIENGRIKTTLARARALRQTIEKIVTLAKKAHAAQDSSTKIHYRRLAIARLRSKVATKKLFDELVGQFVDRQGGYTRIYKLALPRLGDAAEMALIEFVEEPESKKKKKKPRKSSKKVGASKDSEETPTKTDEAIQVDSEDVVTEEDSKVVTEDVSKALEAESKSSSTDEDNAIEQSSGEEQVSEEPQK